MFTGLKNWLSLEGYYFVKRTKAKYYIINRGAGGAGFFSNYAWVMGHVVFAAKLGYIPVVDMKNYPTLYSEGVPVDGELNAWNYYFDNVGGVDLEEAYQSNKYIMAKDMPLHKYAEKYCETEYRFPTAQAIDYYYPVIQKYMKIKEQHILAFSEEWEKNIRGLKKMIGVHIRGTDMKNNLGHPMPAPVEQYFNEIVKMLCEDEDIEGIFLATDEKKVVHQFENFFQRKCKIVTNDAFRSEEQRSTHQTGIHEQKVTNPRKNHRYKMGLEVLKDAWCLSQCDYLVCGHSNISNVVILWNNHQYEQVVCVDTSQ